ncbi:helix-turn-helix domain-containing protein [Nostoc sp.]|uniref:helix-turn-helix domain-containing protein n=1 Tax=Nostoc sp. TaxID=1180 RepID=UPI003046491E
MRQPVNTQIKCHLQRILTAKAIPQAKLAEISGVSPTTINCLCVNKFGRIDMRTSTAICDALQITIADLFELAQKN